MAVVVSISGVDRSDRIDWRSLKIENILTERADKCSFNLLVYGGGFSPSNGAEVIITNGATRIFGGNIVKLIERSVESEKMLEYEVSCVDWTRHLDGRYVAEVYENMTVNAIIADMISRYAPSGFTTTNVSCTVMIDKIAFNWIPISEALRRLAHAVFYDWYVDYSKDIHFFDKEGETAAFNIAANDGSYVQDSLIIRRDNSQIKNSIIVRGGEYLGTNFTTTLLTNGTDFIFPLPYKYTDFRASLTGHAPLSVGVDYLDVADNFDALYNFNEKIIRFKTTDTPSTNKSLRVSGRPHLPVILKVKNQALIDTISAAEGGSGGEYQYLIVDNTLDSKETARQRALAEIDAYGQTLSEAEFRTLTAGLKSGQKISITISDRSLSAEEFIINKVVTTMVDPTNPMYFVSLVTTRTFGIIEVLRDLLMRQTKDFRINQDDIVHQFDGFDETITLSEVLASSLSHNPQSETITLGESFVNNGLNFGTIFVYGSPFVPSGVYRVGIYDGSRYS